MPRSGKESHSLQPNTGKFSESLFIRQECHRHHSLNSSKETLINSEFPRDTDMPPFSITGKLLKMKNKSKSHFDLFCSDHSWMNNSELP
jgi:hypothetical protein